MQQKKSYFGQMSKKLLAQLSENQYVLRVNLEQVC